MHDEGRFDLSIPDEPIRRRVRRPSAASSIGRALFMISGPILGLLVGYLIIQRIYDYKRAFDERLAQIPVQQPQPQPVPEKDEPPPKRKFEEKEPVRDWNEREIIIQKDDDELDEKQDQIEEETEPEKEPKIKRDTRARIDPVPLDLEKSVTAVPVSPAADHAGEELVLELLDAANLPFVAIDPPENKATGTDAVEIVLSKVNANPPSLGVIIRLRLRFHGDTVDAVRIEPLLVNFDNETIPFNVDRLERMIRSAAKDYSKAQRELPVLKEQGQALENRLSRLQSMPANTPTDVAQKKLLIDDVNFDIGRVNDRVARHVNAIPRLDFLRRTLPDLLALAKELHMNAELHFRVFFVRTGTEIELLRADPPEEAAVAATP